MRAWMMAAVLMCAAAPALADFSSPVGDWRTIDDRTHQARGIVRIFEKDGKLYGTVERSLIADPPHRTCDGCTDDRKGKPILGMEVIRGLNHDGDQWDGGTILDPESGTVYRCRLRLEDGGRKLAVRGFVGVAFLGRTQVWERVQ